MDKKFDRDEIEDKKWDPSHHIPILNMSFPE